MQHCLILNQDYTPLATCTWKKALILLYLEKVWLVKEYGNPVIDSSHRQHVRPAAIQLPKYVNTQKRKINFSKRNVFLRDKYRCAYCGSRAGHEVEFVDLNIDHIVPKKQKGASSWENCITACRPCNHRKAARTPEQARMPLLFHPFRPKHGQLPLIHKFGGSFPSEWEEFFNM
jgi:5-methylcytosine-specific restriction endonuclease McrA